MREVISRARRSFSKWIGSNRALVTLGSEFRFGEPIQAPPDERAEDRWQALVSEASRRLECKQFVLWERMDPVVIAASKRPALRQLFPILSMYGSLKFSRCTKYPFSWDLPTIVNNTAGDFVYEVCAAGPSGTVLGSGDADYAADLLVQHVPQNCGPAFLGTVEGLARQIAAAEGVPVRDVLRRLCPLPPEWDTHPFDREVPR